MMVLGCFCSLRAEPEVESQDQSQISVSMWAHAVLWDLIFGFCPLLASRINSLNYSESFFTFSSYKSDLCIQVRASWVDINPPEEDSVDSDVVTAEAVDKIASVVAEVENTVQNFYLCPWKGFGLPSSSVRTC